MAPAETDQNHAVAIPTGRGRYQVAVTSGGATFPVDEPVEVGGLGSGPNPYDLLASALAACTTMTLRLYADRKGWPAHGLRTTVSHHREKGSDPTDVFVRAIEFDEELDQEQRIRLLEIAARCPVHQTLSKGARIVPGTTDHRTPVFRSTTSHGDDMEALVASSPA